MAQEPKTHAADMKRKSRPNIGPVQLSVIKLNEKGERSGWRRISAACSKWHFGMILPASWCLADCAVRAKKEWQDVYGRVPGALVGSHQPAQRNHHHGQ